MELYKISPEFDIIVIYYSGEISITDLKERMRSISIDPKFSKEYDIVNDFRDCNLNVHVNDLSKYIDYLINDIKIINRRKSILLTSKPNQVVLTMVFSNKLINSQLTPFVCSTIESAITFLNKEGLDETTLDLIIEGIKNNTAN